jgi:S1-C subfamily serine protease
LTDSEWELVRGLERQRIVAIEQAMPSVVAVYGDDRQGGGSGVVIHPSGFALTNHHVIMGAGVTGWGGMSDGQMYPWKLIGTDPGGDVALIQMMGKDSFPFTQLADSDLVRTGDWAVAMGNPFILTEDQSPTVTLGIVSGVKRYQPGAGDNQLIYGNCIQIDSSINPGNSGGPLFDLQARIMGINGRGSFLDRGRVNVGLGYAISANQIKNFLADLMATKLVEHGTLDANFSDINGRVTCSTINELSAVAQAGLSLGDRLLEFEGEQIASANQFTNLICTLPANWPAEMLIEKKDGSQLKIALRLSGLPYSKPPQPQLPPDPTPEQQQQIDRQLQMIELLRAAPGTVRNQEQNKFATQIILDEVRAGVGAENETAAGLELEDLLIRDGEEVGKCLTLLDRQGRMWVDWESEGSRTRFLLIDNQFWEIGPEGPELMTLTQAKLKLPIVQGLGLLFANFQAQGFMHFGEVMLDGSDKALRRPSARLKFLDAEKDWFYCWVGLSDGASETPSRLSKASADMDCGGRQGGVVFNQWRSEQGWQIPGTREFVAGLGEDVLFSLSNQRITALSASELELRFNAAKEELE